MNLAIDIGNTHIKFGLFNGNEQPVVHTGEEALTAILQHQAISHAIVSKTGKNETVEQLLQQYRIPTLVLSQQLKLPITIQYKTPHTLVAHV